MTQPKKTLFISDLHLEQNRPKITQQFLQLLEGCDNSVEALYILGDLFEVWIGDDDDSPLNQEIIQALKKTTSRGLPIYFTPGNRDFLIGKRFLKQTGCKLLPDEKKITLYGNEVLLMHGDTLCISDEAYLKWRKKSHNPILNRLLFLWWPLSFRRKFANKMRTQSALHTRCATQEMMDVTQTEVERILQKHKVNYLIHGHTHRPAVHEFDVNNSQATRIVLAAWHDHGSVFIWDETGKKEFISLTSS